MTQNTEKPNKNTGCGHIDGFNPSHENITTFDHRIFVSARWLAARFQISYELMRRVIDDVELTGHVVSMVYRDGSTIWVGDDAFVEIYQHPYVDDKFDETARMSVLQLLGHYQRVAS